MPRSSIRAPLRGPSSRALVALGGALALVLVLAAGLALRPVPAAARVGGRPQSFTLPAVPGGPTRGRFRLADHLGRDVVAILFWATWCAPCRQELPVYQALYERHQARGLVVVGISMDGSATVSGAGPMARRLGLTFPVLSDLDTRVTAQLNPRRAAPFSIWIDRGGRVVREREGFSLGERDEVHRGIGALLGLSQRR